MKKRVISIMSSLVLLVGIMGLSTPVAAGGFSAAGALIPDPEMPAVVAVLLQDGFSPGEAEALSATIGELLASAGLLGLDTSGAVVFSRSDLVGFQLGDADTLDNLLRNTGLLYIAITGSVLSNDPAIGHAIRFDLEAPSVAPMVLGSVILPYDLVMDPLAFITTLGIDLGGLGI
jgi:hypothetical protein